MSDRLITTGERFVSVYDTDQWKGALRPLGDTAAAELAADLELIRSVRTYRIIRWSRPHYKNLREVVDSGVVGYLEANAKAAELQRQYDRDNPDKNNWTKDLFCVELERGDEINAALGRMRIRRCRGDIA